MISRAAMLLKATAAGSRRLGRPTNLVVRWCATSSTASASASAADEKESDASLRERLMQTSLRHVQQTGWTQDAVSRAVAELELPPLAHAILPSGPLDVLLYFLAQKRQFVQREVGLLQQQQQQQQQQQADQRAGQQADGAEPPLETDLLHFALSKHLDFIEPYRTHWPQAMGLLVDPRVALSHHDVFLDVVNDLADYSGLRTVRFDWYTERGILATLMLAAEVYMLTDTSAGFQETKDFMRRMLADLRSLRGSERWTWALSLAQSLGSGFTSLLAAIPAWAAQRTSSSSSSAHSDHGDYRGSKI